MLLKTQSLTPDVLRVVRDQGTELPFSGEYNTFEAAGTYLCRQCGLALFRSQSKFHSSCGWPAFDGEIQDAVKRRPDADGCRTEILCARCDAHLGHVFEGEGLTAVNIRHCVNSLSLDFVPDIDVKDSEEALFAGGCFWGVEYFLKQLPGVLKTEVGYAGGQQAYPNYESVCRGDSGHFETVRVLYDPERISYKTLVQYFFEIHDPTQEGGQGPDRGAQYLSAIFYYNEAQKNTIEQCIQILKKRGYSVVTHLYPVEIFWPGESDHQDYYRKTGKLPYCHRYVKRFG